MEQCSCNGRLVNDPQFGKVIELFGDQRRTVSSFLVQEGIVKKKHVKIHGF
uniref:Protein translation factor SUI1 isogeny n=2 Tax=Cajanus cajan TaxID=3821 RepID=A0A151SZA8_CAJCA|nr:Protein translation factor SUI1 isogeny [Cajanus cajan]